MSAVDFPLRTPCQGCPNKHGCGPEALIECALCEGWYCHNSSCKCGLFADMVADKVVTQQNEGLDAEPSMKQKAIRYVAVGATVTACGILCGLVDGRYTIGELSGDLLAGGFAAAMIRGRWLN